MRTKLKLLKTLVLCSIISMNAFAQIDDTNQDSKSATTNVYGFSGNCFDTPEFGFNAPPRIQNGLDYWDPAQTGLLHTYDEMNIKYLRFPGGTVANNYNWLQYRMSVTGVREYPGIYQTNFASTAPGYPIPVSEGSFLSVSRIGCLSDCVPSLDCNANTNPNEFIRYANLLNGQASKLADFKAGVDAIGAKPIYVLNMIDPFAYISNGQSLVDAQNQIAQAVLTSIKRQLIKILSAYTDVSGCDYSYNTISSFDGHNALGLYTEGCVYLDDDISFELGNEFYFNKYAKFFPNETCLGQDSLNPCTTGCSEGDCTVSPLFYATLADEITKLIRTKFPKSKIAVIGGNRNKPVLNWTDVVLDHLASQNTAFDAITLHFYGNGACTPSSPVNDIHGRFDLEDQLDIDHQLESLHKEVWITEFNLNNGTVEEGAGSSPGLMTWTNTLRVSEIINTFFYRLPGNIQPQFSDYYGDVGKYPITRILGHNLIGPENNIFSALYPTGTTSPVDADVAAFGIAMKIWAMAAEDANYARPLFFTLNPNGTMGSNEHTSCGHPVASGCNAFVDTIKNPLIYGWHFSNDNILIINRSTTTVDWAALNGNALASGYSNFVQISSPNLNNPVSTSAPCFIDLDPGSNCSTETATNLVVTRPASMPFLIGNSITLMKAPKFGLCLKETADPHVPSSISVSAYPNPVADNLNLNIITNDDKDNIHYTFHNAQGVAVKQGNLSGSGNHTIAVDNLPVGLYIISLHLKDHTTTHKIIVQR